MFFWKKEKYVCSKDLAKFAAGAATIEILNHTALMLNNLLPLHFFGFVISRTINLIILLGWIIVFVTSVYYAWMKKS